LGDSRRRETKQSHDGVVRTRSRAGGTLKRFLVLISLIVGLEPATTNGDPELVERLIANLLSNAIRHNHAGGRVRVATGTAAGAANLTVTNTGPVIPAEQVPRLFDPFQRLETPNTDPGNGLGLGLTIIDAITSAHGAVLRVRPNPEGGLHVEIRFDVPTTV
jgi:signal transduction histidine kinase